MVVQVSVIVQTQPVHLGEHAESSRCNVVQIVVTKIEPGKAGDVREEIAVDCFQVVEGKADVADHCGSVYLRNRNESQGTEVVRTVEKDGRILQGHAGTFVLETERLFFANGH